MKVLKFGGSSVAKPERIRGIVDILKDYYKRGDHFTVVFSAFGGVTDSLILMGKLAEQGDESYLEHFEVFSDRHQAAVDELFDPQVRKQVLPELQRNHEVLKNLLYGIYLVREASPRSMDYVLSFGERNSSYLIAHFMQQQGIQAEYLDARKIIKTNKNFGSAKVDFNLTYENIRTYYTEHPSVQVVTGFVASAKGGLTTTLGRGGSDFTASLLAAGLQAERIEIWTDVSGVLTADQRRVRKAFTIPSMTYAEAMEMSHFGAKGIYPPTLQPALKEKIPLYIKNTFEPSFDGTLISAHIDPKSPPVKGISSISEVALLTLSGGGLFGVPGIAARLFNSLALANINIILITQGSSEHSISFAVQPAMAERARKRVEKEFEYEMDRGLVDSTKVEADLSVVAIIGENMRYRPGIAGHLFQALGKNGINTIAIAQGSSELNISVVIPRADESKALNALHETFFLSDTKQLHLFMVGVGLIGGTLLSQIQKQSDFLAQNHGMEIRVVGLANSKRMVFDEAGLDLNNWQETLTESPDISDLAVFVQRMKNINLSNTIFIDNTATAKVAGFYESILDSSISISTPNKIATSSAYLQYERLKTIAAKRGVQFHYETNVGAGLPVISTLQDLILSGDQMLSIEGVLSGSLSFIFNHFTEGTRFSDIVKEAGERGYTEPDPRIDLNGVDVQRKLLILARETGLPLEGTDIKIESILPEAAQAAETIEDFFQVLEEHDDFFAKLRDEALAKGEVLRMIAHLEKNKATIGLRSLSQKSPFFFLSGSDNMIVFTSERYKERPLVVRGPGAGAEVTAAGVFAEIIKIGNYL